MSNLIDFLEKVNKQKEIVEKARVSLAKKQNVLEAIFLNCDHNHGTYVKEDYFEGSYNDKAYTDVLTYCNVCGKLLNSRTRQHSWFC